MRSFESKNKITLLQSFLIMLSGSDHFCEGCDPASSKLVQYLLFPTRKDRFRDLRRSEQLNRWADYKESFIVRETIKDALGLYMTVVMWQCVYYFFMRRFGDCGETYFISLYALFAGLILMMLPMSWLTLLMSSDSFVYKVICRMLGFSRGMSAVAMAPVHIVEFAYRALGLGVTAKDPKWLELNKSLER